MKKNTKRETKQISWKGRYRGEKEGGREREKREKITKTTKVIAYLSSASFWRRATCCQNVKYADVEIHPLHVPVLK